MSAVSGALFTVLAGDGALAGMLADYRGGPAVFTVDPAPADAVLPYIVTAGDVATVPADTKTSRGRRVTRDVRCYTAAEGSAVLVERIAERARSLLHRARIDVDGFSVVVVDVSGPFNGPAEPDAYARILTAHITLEES